MHFEVQLIGEASDGRFWGDLGTLNTPVQPVVGMYILYKGHTWKVRDVMWKPEESPAAWAVLEVRVEKE